MTDAPERVGGRPRPVVLCILDGYGVAPPGPGNAIALAKKPNLDRLFAGPAATLAASGHAVGLPEGVMGNSEVGHLTIGAGRAQRQDYVRINDDIANGSFFRNEALLAACRAARERGTKLHLMGLVSAGGVHADVTHFLAMLELARRERVSRVALHAFLDGRDMPPRSALPLLERLRAAMAGPGSSAAMNGPGSSAFASVGGRYYAMDRDRRWERVRRAYEAIALGRGPTAASVEDAVRRCYERGDCRDELMEPVVVARDGRPVATVDDGDAMVHLNFRPDRARQLTLALMQDEFAGFPRERRPRDLFYATMTEYKLGLPGIGVAYAPQAVRSIAEILSERGLRQLHCAETEKYAHVTYFFNGGREPPFAGEERLLVPSPQARTYDLEPAMSARGVAEATERAIRSGGFDFVAVNFANADMVGHTGALPATVAAIEVVDDCVGRLMRATREAGGALLLTADHGNAEELLDPAGGMLTQHSTNPVPIAYAGPGMERLRLRDGELSDVAPTLLELLGIAAPAEMTGRSLFVHAEAPASR